MSPKELLRSILERAQYSRHYNVIRIVAISTVGLVVLLFYLAASWTLSQAWVRAEIWRAVEHTIADSGGTDRAVFISCIAAVCSWAFLLWSTKGLGVIRRICESFGVGGLVGFSLWSLVFAYNFFITLPRVDRANAAKIMSRPHQPPPLPHREILEQRAIPDAQLHIELQALEGITFSVTSTKTTVLSEDRRQYRIVVTNRGGASIDRSELRVQFPFPVFPPHEIGVSEGIAEASFDAEFQPTLGGTPGTTMVVTGQPRTRTYILRLLQFAPDGRLVIRVVLNRSNPHGEFGPPRVINPSTSYIDGPYTYSGRGKVFKKHYYGYIGIAASDQASLMMMPRPAKLRAIRGFE
jgi:hypothetical protein